MPTAVNLSDSYLNADRQLEVVENFAGGAPSNWTATATSGTVAALSQVGGGISLTTQASDNAAGTLTLNSAPLLVAANKPITFAGRLQYAEAATNQANVGIGLASGSVASVLGNNGAGTPANYTGFMFYKVDLGTVWVAESQVGTTKTTTSLVAGAGFGINKVTRTAGGSAYVLFEIDIIPKTSTTCDVVYRMDGVTVAKHTDVVFTGAAQMAPVALVRAGSTTAEAIKVNLMKFCAVI